jgi:hypothetical protein
MARDRVCSVARVSASSILTTCNTITPKPRCLPQSHIVCHQPVIFSHGQAQGCAESAQSRRRACIAIQLTTTTAFHASFRDGFQKGANNPLKVTLGKEVRSNEQEPPHKGGRQWGLCKNVKQASAVDRGSSIRFALKTSEHEMCVACGGRHMPSRNTFACRGIS